MRLDRHRRRHQLVLRQLRSAEAELFTGQLQKLGTTSLSFEGFQTRPGEMRSSMGEVPSRSGTPKVPENSVASPEVVADDHKAWTSILRSCGLEPDAVRWLSVVKARQRQKRWAALAELRGGPNDSSLVEGGTGSDSTTDRSIEGGTPAKWCDYLNGDGSSDEEGVDPCVPSALPDNFHGASMALSMGSSEVRHHESYNWDGSLTSRSLSFGCDGARDAGVTRSTSSGSMNAIRDWWDVGVDASVSRDRQIAARRSAYAAANSDEAMPLGGGVAARMEAAAAERGESEALWAEAKALKKAEVLLAKFKREENDTTEAARSKTGKDAGSDGSNERQLCHRLSHHFACRTRMIALRREAMSRRFAMIAAEMEHRRAIEETEMYKFPRALPEALSPAQALESLLSDTERMAAGCRRLDEHVRALHSHRLNQLQRDRAARIPYPTNALGGCLSSSVPAASLAALPLMHFVRLPDPHACAAAAASHCCAATLRLRVALAAWLAEVREPLQILAGTSPRANSAKLHALAFCANAAGLTARVSREFVAAWLLQEFPAAIAVPYLDVDDLPPSEIADAAHDEATATDLAGASASQHPHSAQDFPTGAAFPTAHAPVPLESSASATLTLEGGAKVCAVTASSGERSVVWDGAAFVRGKYDGEASGASFEPGPWRWDARGGDDGTGAWLKDSHPHEALILTPCSHAYSELFWTAKLSTKIEQSSRTGRWAAQRARCCAPLVTGGFCGAQLRRSAGFRFTHANPPRIATLPPGGGYAPLMPFMSSVPIHGALGSRVDIAVRLLLSLRHHASESGASLHESKAVVFSRFDATLNLLSRACSLNGISCLTLSAQCGSFHARAGANTPHEVARFCDEPTVQALLLSAGRSAAGLTLTAARHVIILEPQIEMRTELQMIGRVHRIGQLRQTHVHRIAISGSGEETVAQWRARHSDKGLEW